MSDNRRIAKNTLFLYFRMILIMGVTLYTSRVVLDILGVDDYGLYSVVGGVVGMLSFINGTLSMGTSRFLTYELGKGDSDRLHKTFYTSFFTHLGLSLILVLIFETIGLWFVYHKLVIPADRMNAAVWAYHISIATSVVSITQVPYTSLIMAYEKMSIYAYISIFEAIAKLLIVYLLLISGHDKLVVYALLMAAVQIMTALLYRGYCRKKFSAAKLKLDFDKSIFRSLMSFSGWNIMANFTETIKSQGVIVLINLFFAPAIVSAQAIANQVANAMMQFVSNFRTAINPQIIKLYAAGNYEESRKLTLNTTIYCFDLTLVLGLPAIVAMDKIMHLWLVEVPEYAVVFTQWIIAINLVAVFNSAFYIPMVAANKIKTNSIVAVILGIGQFVLLYSLFKLGLGPMWVQYVAFIMMIVLSLIVKPLIIHKEVGYSISELLFCFWSCIKVLILSLTITFIVNSLFCEDNFLHIFFKAGVALFSTLFASFLFLDKHTKRKMIDVVLSKIRIIKN